ncbi:unnamed protein product, partial [Brenthis ino]
MKSFIVFALVLATALAAPPQTNDRDAQIVRYESDNIGIDGYSYGFETSNGIQASENGALTNPGTDAEALEVRGAFSYYGPDGILYEVTYTADKDGFHPNGAHFPQAP